MYDSLSSKLAWKNGSVGPTTSILGRRDAPINWFV